MVEGLVGLKVLRTLRRYREVEGRWRRARRRSEPATAPRMDAARRGGKRRDRRGARPRRRRGGRREPGRSASSPSSPFFVSLRQTLEHRDEDAHPGSDYTRVDHGGDANRLFGDGPVANTLGSAGFNRHALHHWEPQVSLHRLRELERYLDRDRP